MQNVTADILVALKIFGFGIIRYHFRNGINKIYEVFFLKREEWIYSLVFLGWRKEDGYVLCQSSPIRKVVAKGKVTLMLTQR